jgi:crossover junction endodeoxyribonuclease RusA
VIRLELPYPISANRYWQPVRIKPKRGTDGKERITIVPTSEAKGFKRDIGWLAKSAGIRSPLTCSVALTFTLVPKNGICMDLDNALKVSIDALKGIVYADDSQVRKITAERVAPNGKGGLIVEIDTYADEQGDMFPVERAIAPLEQTMRVVPRRADGKPF